MKVKKRGNRGVEDVSFDKIIRRISTLGKDLNGVDAARVAQETIKNIKDMIATREIDLISAAIAETMKSTHPNYSVLAARIFVDNLHKETPAKFSEFFSTLVTETNVAADWAVNFVKDFAGDIDRMINHDNDYLFDYFGLKTLEQGYLNRVNFKNGQTDPSYGDIPYKIIERPQYIFMRVAIHLYCPPDYLNNPKNTDLKPLFSKEYVAAMLNDIKECYKTLSQQKFTHATPTLFNSCMKIGQLMSCFLFGSHDSVEGITHCIDSVARISKTSGGIGVHMSMIRAAGQLIRGTNGKSGGLIPQLKIYDATITCFNQGGKRNGSMAVYLEPWHADIFEFLDAKSQVGNESSRARNLFYALMINDLFVKRLEEDRKIISSEGRTKSSLSEQSSIKQNNDKDNKDNRVMWSLFSEDDAPGLSDSYGAEFEKIYERYEKEGRYIRRVPTNDLFTAILVSMLETGGPYILHKDHINYKSNQSNIGTIKSSNLCAEIVQYSDHKNYAVCCLASINLPIFIKPAAGSKVTADNILSFYDFTALGDTVKIIVRNLNKVLDRNNYPVPETKKSAMETRAIGIGTQGLTDVFMRLRIPYISAAAEILDRAIQETIYYNATLESSNLAAKDGSYKFFEGSPSSNGILQPDLCALNEKRMFEICKDKNCFTSRANDRFCPIWDWELLRQKVKTNGLRNSLLCANMPTGSTSQILGNFETTEPPTSNCFNRNTLAGLFTIFNKYLFNHLVELNLWSETIKKKIIAAEGSIQSIMEIPAEVREIYKTVWEIDRKQILIRAAQRSAFIDQTQSLNIYIPAQWKKDMEGNFVLDEKRQKIDIRSVTLAQVFLAGWRYGLKTGSYYIRSTAKNEALSVGIAKNFNEEKKEVIKNNDNKDDGPTCKKEDGCIVCSS